MAAAATNTWLPIRFGAVGLGTLLLMGYTDAPPGWWREFILASPARTAKLAVVRADGSPHVAPVWVDLDGDQVVFMTSADTIKGRAILRDPRVSLCWDDERPPFSFVTVAGIAATSADAGGQPASAGGTWVPIARRSTAGATGCRLSLSCGLARRELSPRSRSRTRSSWRAAEGRCPQLLDLLT
jgi:PPOX class probable F420-dependent enzyme